jgi:hypothetical protein
MAIYSLISRGSFDIHLGYVERNSRTKKHFLPMGISSKNHFFTKSQRA